MPRSRSFVGRDFTENANAEGFRDWFADHFSLDGKPYTLDLDQARAVLDDHKNTLVTARAGSGKTRVIVAKIAYLLATEQLRPHEIAAFMFNRTAAAEVNQRIAKVEFDGRPIGEIVGGSASQAGSSAAHRNESREEASRRGAPRQEIAIASTFHKFALDLVKLSGARPELISEAEHDRIVRQSLNRALAEQNRHVSAREFDDLLKIVSGFVARAGQKYFGERGITELREAVSLIIDVGETNTEKTRLHQLALATYKHYLSALRPPKLDFNIMMAEASELLRQTSRATDKSAHNTKAARGGPELAAGDQPASAAILSRTAPLKLILIDEYQDFSQLFLSLIESLRAVCPEARLFTVGDDWQAINRFAGSDVDYFINFAKHFPEDAVNIPLMTNYRSCCRIVENANDYMLRYYDPAEAARLLKSVVKILRKNRQSEIMLLHRHNFTTFPGVSLETFHRALKILATDEGIIDAEAFDRGIRCMTIHKSKGLEADVVILLEANRDLILGHHPTADLWGIFGDSLTAEKADQHRLLYVAMTRAKQKLYVLSTDRKAAI